MAVCRADIDVVFDCAAIATMVNICNMSANERAHPDSSQGPADLQSAALATELCTHTISFRIVGYTSIFNGCEYDRTSNNTSG